MLSAVITGAAAMQAFAMRPEASAASLKIAKLADSIQEHPSDTMAAIEVASAIVNDIMLEAGNATKHLAGGEQETLENVTKMIRETMYASMLEDHSQDEDNLDTAIAHILECNTDIAEFQSPTGKLGRGRLASMESQHELDRLHEIVDDKTRVNRTTWDAFSFHMSWISTPPPCPALPARTMPTLDVYFKKSDYSVWFAAQQPQYYEKRDEWIAARDALAEAIEAFDIQKAVRDAHYCDWKTELLSECALFDECFADRSDYYSNTLVPQVKSSIETRIAAYKAGQTLIAQVEFLLAVKDTSETGTIDTSDYKIEFAALPAKGSCDLSPLTSSIWTPPVTCEADNGVPNVDRHGQNCGKPCEWWEKKGLSCDWCGEHDGKEQHCCRPGWKDPGCDAAVYKGSPQFHQCVTLR